MLNARPALRSSHGEISMDSLPIEVTDSRFPNHHSGEPVIEAIGGQWLRQTENLSA